MDGFGSSDVLLQKEVRDMDIQCLGQKSLPSLSQPVWLTQFGDLLLHAFTITQGLKHSQLSMGAKLILFTLTLQDYAGLMLDLLLKFLHAFAIKIL